MRIVCRLRSPYSLLCFQPHAISDISCTSVSTVKQTPKWHSIFKADTLSTHDDGPYSHETVHTPFHLLRLQEDATPVPGVPSTSADISLRWPASDYDLH